MQISISKLRQIIKEETAHVMMDEGVWKGIKGAYRLAKRIRKGAKRRQAYKDKYGEAPKLSHVVTKWGGKPKDQQGQQDVEEEKPEPELQEYKVDTPKHFNPSQMPGTADDVFHDCIASVKKSFKKHDYPLKKGKTLEDAAAAICTDSRKEGGATLDWGIKRKREVEKARPGGKSGYEKDVKSG